MPEKDVAYASFEQKWLDANPEQAAVSIFIEPSLRQTANAFGTLIHEIAHTAFGVRETQVAAAKLGWWQQELANAASGNSRHPISRELFRGAAASIETVLWRDLIDGAISQLDAATAASFDGLVARLAEFYRPVVAIESQIHGDERDEASVNLWIASHLTSMFRAATLERIEIPLDVLVRHGAARADLVKSGPLRSAVLKDFLSKVRAMLAKNLDSAAAADLGRRVRGRLDLQLLNGALRANDPAQFIATRYHRMRWRSVWLAWREARAAQKPRA